MCIISRNNRRLRIPRDKGVDLTTCLHIDLIDPAAQILIVFRKYAVFFLQVHSQHRFPRLLITPGSAQRQAFVVHGQQKPISALLFRKFYGHIRSVKTVGHAGKQMVFVQRIGAGTAVRTDVLGYFAIAGDLHDIAELLP